MKNFQVLVHFFRFQGIDNIPSYVYYTFCLIYHALPDENFPSFGFHQTCFFSDFKE